MLCDTACLQPLKPLNFKVTVTLTRQPDHPEHDREMAAVQISQTKIYCNIADDVSTLMYWLKGPPRQA
jgi:hypothetical protein